MRAQRVVLSLVVMIVAGIAAGSALSQEYRGTYEQQMACTPDVWRLCFDQIPDANRITACLRQKTPQLSDPCRAVFESNASAQQQPQVQAPPRGRAVQPPPRPRTDDDQ